MHRRSHVPPYEGAVTVTLVRVAPVHTPSHCPMVTELPVRLTKHCQRTVTADADNPIHAGLLVNTHRHAELEVVRDEHFVCCVLLHARFFADSPQAASRAGTSRHTWSAGPNNSGWITVGATQAG